MGFRVEGLWGLGFGVRISGLGLKVYRVPGLGFRAEGLRFRALGLGLWASGLLGRNYQIKLPEYGDIVTQGVAQVW